MSRSEFHRVAQLLQLVFQNVETSALADLRKSDLTRAEHAVLELQTAATRLRTKLNGLFPIYHRKAPALQPESHSERRAHAALEHIHANYAKPITLQQCARGLGMNPAYLSCLFSRTVGLPFKAYLTDLRLEKARELLSNSAKAISEIAYAVGYGSENRFRIVFKSATGLAPRAWRETLRMES